SGAAAVGVGVARWTGAKRVGALACWPRRGPGPGRSGTASAIGACAACGGGAGSYAGDDAIAPPCGVPLLATLPGAAGRYTPAPRVSPAHAAASARQNKSIECRSTPFTRDIGVILSWRFSAVSVRIEERAEPGSYA